MESWFIDGVAGNKRKRGASTRLKVHKSLKVSDQLYMVAAADREVTCTYTQKPLPGAHSFMAAEVIT